MLADWYFCSALRLTILQTSEYLDTLEILRSPTSDISHLGAALDWLAASETTLQLHALPSLLASSSRLRIEPTLAERAAMLCTGLVSAAGDADAESASADEDTVDEALTALLREVLQGPDEDFAERTVATLQRIPPKRPEPTGADIEPEPYQDLHEHIRESVALALLDVAAQQDPGAVESACVGSARLAVVEDALGNTVGRQPLLLTASVLRRVAPTAAGAEVRECLADAGSGAGDLEPDLLGALGRSWFGHPGDDPGPEPAVLEVEIAGGRLFPLWPAQNNAATSRRAAARARLGTGSTPDQMVRTVLWQLTLWELAAEHQPETTARLTQRWWGPPADHRDQAPDQHQLAAIEVPWPDLEWTGQDTTAVSRWLAGSARIHWLTRQSPAPDLPVASPGEPGADPCTGCSPWLDRKDGTFRLPRETPPDNRPKLSAYPQAGEGLLLLQMLAATSAAVRLLRAAGSVPAAPLTDMPGAQVPRGHLVALIFHCKDVLTDVRFRFFLDDLNHGADRPRDLPVSTGLAALAWHVLQSVDRAGKGDYAEIPAGWFAEFLLDGPGKEGGGAEPGGRQYEGLQWKRLFGGPALHGARQWIEETSSDVRRSPDTYPGATGWFDGPAPYARRMLAFSVQQLQEAETSRQPASAGEQPTGRSALASAQLLRQNFPGVHVDVDLDWMAQLPVLLETHRTNPGKAKQGRGRGRSSPLTWRLLLAADPYPLDAWLEHAGEIESLTSDGPDRMAMVTLRMAALLSHSEPGDDTDVPEWAEDWFDLMAAINDPSGWARAVRRLALDLFNLPTGGLTTQDRARKVLEVVVDSIVEFSANAPRYYQGLLQALAADRGPLYAEGMDRLRVRAVHTIRRQVRDRREPNDNRGPWRRLAEQSNRGTIERLLRGFLITVGTSEVAWNDRQMLSQAFLESWLRAAANPAGPELRPAGNNGEFPDPRLVAARILDHYTGTEQFGLLDRAVGRRADGTVVTDLSSLEPADRAHKLSQWRRYLQPRNVSGTVCALDPADPTGRTLLVNWGGGSPLRVTDRSGTPYRPLGAPCVLSIRWDQGAGHWEPAGPEPLRDAGRPAPQPEEVRTAQVTLAPSLRVSVDGVRGDVARKADTAGEATALQHWDPDLSRALASVAGSAESDQPDETLARWDADLGHWLPADRTLTELIAGDMPYAASGGLPATVMVYVGPGRPSRPQEHDAWRFATRPGRCFLLHPQDWGTSRTDLEDVLRHGPGVLVYAALAGPADPRLTLLPSPPAGAEQRWPALAAGRGCDTRNNDWLELFNAAEEHVWEAQLHDGTWTADVSGAPRYPHGAGFPSTVTVAGLETEGRSQCPFHPEPWEEAAARRAEVTGEPLRPESLAGDLRNPTAEQFDALWNIRERSVYRLRRFLGGRTVRRSFAEALTTNGLTIRVERDSLPYALPPIKNTGLPAAVEITKVSPPRSRPTQPAGAPLAEGQLGSLLPDPARPGSTLNAVIVTVYWGTGGIPNRYGVWLDTPAGPVAHELPAGCFTLSPRRAGETCTGTLTPNGWEFTPTGRTIYARALYQREPADIHPDRAWHYIGWFRDRGTGYALFTRPDSGLLVTLPQPRPSGSPLGMHATVVERLGGGAPRKDIPHMRVRVKTGPADLVGDAPETSAVPGVVSRVTLQVRVRADGLISIRRELAVIDATAGGGLPGSTRRIEEEWREQLAAGEFVRVSGRLAGDTLHVSGARLPLVDGDAPHVAGVPYSNNRVSALVVERNGTLLADTRLAPPYTSEEFAAEVVGVPHGSHARRRDLTRYVYYVGVEENSAGTARRFEWGRGLTVLLGNAEITVGGEPCHDERAFPMFHGDRLTRADFLIDAQGRRILNINPEDVELQTAGQVYEEAKKKIVHRLVIHVDLKTGHVAVRQVQLRRARISTDQADQSQRREIAAELDLNEESKRRILAAAAASPRTISDLAELEILARFDHDAYRRHRGRQRKFTYVQSRFASAAGIAPDEHLFMVAGEITRPTDNDTYIEFRLPSTVLQEPGVPPLTIRVARKQFSCREYLLPQLFDEGRSSYYTDRAVMLVQVHLGERDGRWYGDLTRPPARGADTLASAVDQAGGSLLAALSGSSAKRVELRPGVICELGPADGLSSVRWAGRGALVRVSRHDGGLNVVLAQRPDHDYISPHGERPALLLPKQPLLGHHGIAQAAKSGMFTVATLPAVSATAGSYGTALLRSPHPRLAALRTEGQDQITGPPDSVAIRAAKVQTSGDQPMLRTVAPVGGQVPDGASGQPGPAQFATRWALLSFRDTDTETLRERCTLTWHYHDAKTGHWSNGSRPRTYDIRDRHLANEPVFFDEHGGRWTLRYRPETISRFGAPATALTERRRNANQTPPGQTSEDSAEWYAVAYPAIRHGQRTPWGLWVELGPGRVIEIGGPLVTGPGSLPLDELAWGHFGTGDLVKLEPVRRNVTEPRLLRLTDWWPSPRSALLPEQPLAEGTVNRALLPIKTVDRTRGGLRLGYGAYALDYPVSPSEARRYQPGQAVWLYGTNHLSSAAADGLRPGDTALLAAGKDGSLRLLAMPGQHAEPSTNPDSWPGSEWLAELLRSPERGAALRAMGGCVPVTIEQATGDTVEFSRRLQPSGHWPHHGLVRCMVTGWIDDQLLLRSGSAIYRLAVREVVPGVPREQATAAARSLAEGNHTIWCRLPGRARRDGSRQPDTKLPLPSQPAAQADEFDALPLAVIGDEDTPHGLLLRGIHDQGYRWMFASHASWLDRPTTAELKAFLVDPGLPLRVREGSDGRVSVTRVRATSHQRAGLALGSTLRVEPLTVPRTNAFGISGTIARVCENQVLLWLNTEVGECAVGETTLTEVAALGGRYSPIAVATVLSGRRRYPVDLPARLTTDRPEPAAQAQDRLAALHAHWWNEGPLNEPHLGAAADPTEELLRAAGCAVTAGQEGDPRIRYGLDRWLTAYGEIAFNLRLADEIELSPVLAACLLLAQRGEQDDSTAARGAVLLAHQVGLRAARSLHVELIARHWLPIGRADAPARSMAAHARLAALRIPPEMDRTQLRAALWFGHGILARTEDGSLDDGSAPIARAVLAAVGKLMPGPDLAQGAEILAPLAGLGRALHPPQGEATAQTRLLPEQVTELTALLRRTLELPLPLLPLPPHAQLGPEASRLARALLRPESGQSV